MVTLRSPPLLDTAMAVVADDDLVRVLHGDVTVAEGARASLTVDTVPPVDVATARATSANYPGLIQHPFPECFVCGPARAAGDGLRMFPGRLGDGRTACIWTVECVVMGLFLGAEGRKIWTSTTAYGADGRELGRSHATWLAIPTAP